MSPEANCRRKMDKLRVARLYARNTQRVIGEDPANGHGPPAQPLRNRQALKP